MEVWNNVFTQFENDGKGNYTLLENKNIDTGMGLERLAVVVQDVDSIFDVDTIKALRDKVCEMANVSYKENEKNDISIRLITDHIRSVTFMTSDGILPSNEGRGYVLRRLLRRAARHGRLLGIKEGFLAELSKTVIECSKDAYPELEEKKEHIFSILNTEEENFNKTIDQGLSILNGYINETKSEESKTLAGDKAFKLYDTYGFPLDLTKEILEEAGIEVDEEGFNACMEEQRVKARNARKTTNYMGADATVYEQIPLTIDNLFVGYDSLTHKSKINALTTETEVVKELHEGESGSLFVAGTPFYATMGGQCGDSGVISSESGEFIVQDTIKVVGGKTAHVGYVSKGSFKLGDDVKLSVDENQRALTCKNHSATHLLQKALKMVLGAQVEQAGSYVAKDRLRFDFTYNKSMTKEEIAKVEEIVNKEIENDIAVTTDIMSLEEAKKTGAMALFGEKYGESVRVVSMGDFSKELCGGTHVSSTGVINTFKIVSEAGVAAGVRRIEALTSKGAFDYYKTIEDELNNASIKAKTEPSKLADKIDSLMAEIKALQSENQKLKDKLAKDSAKDVMGNVVECGSYKILPVDVKDIDMNALRNLGDDMKAKIGSGIVILASSNEGKVNLIVMATDDAVKNGAHAGNIIKKIAGFVGGGGGGRPNMAQAGGKNPEGIKDALNAGVEEAKVQLGS